MDLSPDMLAWDAAHRPPAAAGAVDALPLADAAVDDVVAAFVLNHVSDPGAALAELIRVTRPGGALLASVYATTNRSAARDRIDDVVRAHGWTAPDWYAHLKTVQAPLLGDAPAMTAAARAAGLESVDVVSYDADIGLDRVPDLVDYRLGQAHVAAWLAGQDDRARERRPRRGDRRRHPGDAAVPAARRPTGRPRARHGRRNPVAACPVGVATA